MLVVSPGISLNSMASISAGVSRELDLPILCKFHVGGPGAGHIDHPYRYPYRKINVINILKGNRLN